MSAVTIGRPAAPAVATAGRRLADFRDLHADGTFLVCGLGESLNLLTTTAGAITIGVNDVERRLTPDYLVVVNPRSQFSADRFRHVDASRARALFTQLPDLGVAHPNVVTFRLGAYGGTEFADPDVLHYTQNSPYVAACLAVHMGARRIGLIGVDFTDHHFFGRTGRHALAARLDQIDREYARLGAACRARRVELVNLSPSSRLSGLPRVPLESFLAAPPTGRPEPPDDRRRVFFVTYRFLACGDVFTEGLRHAAEDLGLEWADAAWDDPHLPAKVAQFRPDLLFVVHGRKFSRRWGRSLAGYRSAVWLLDEPYEVDDTSGYSRLFQHVFVNDPATLGCHRNAHYLPVCYDPRVHFPTADPQRYDVGFVGGANPTRERFLLALARRGLLGYVVGGPWRNGALNRYCVAANTPPEETAALYRATQIVVNVFRDAHHFNRRRLEGAALNPRVYEALACGALVISERRAELAALVPELPTFADERELVTLVEHFLHDPDHREIVRAACTQRLRDGTYRERLRSVMSLTRVHQEPAGDPVPDLRAEVPSPTTPSGTAETATSRPPDATGPEIPGAQWQECGPIDCREAEGTLILRATTDPAPGSERGIASRVPYEGVALSFEAFIPGDTAFIAKIHQAGAHDQTANSYHLHCDPRAAYLARHHHVFRAVTIARDAWESFRLTHVGAVLSLYVGDRLVHRVRERVLSRGYAFLGVKTGEVRLRNVRLSALGAVDPAPRGEEATPTGAGLEQQWSGPDATVIHVPTAGAPPRVTIVTTVYDRVDCLRRCIRSVKALTWRDYEHIIVSDCPQPPVVEAITQLVREEDDGRIGHLDLTRRSNNWGIAPAAAGLARARGEFVGFLSDDNGYLPEHLGPLVEVLDHDPKLGFAYSSCLYAGRLVLRHPAPGPGRIDLGQPLFRRELFARYFGGGLPFNVIAWDWALIDALLKRGVRCKHVDRASFVFRLANYPRILAGLP